MSEEQDDKQFDPSETKLRRAREKGDIPRSQDASVALSYAGMLLALTPLAGVFLPRWLGLAQRLLGAEPWPSRETGLDLVAGLAGRSAGLVLMLLTAPAVLVLTGLIVQRGLVFTPSRLAPDAKRINPLKNAGQKFGRSGLVTFLLSVGKAAFVGIGGWFLFAALAGRLGAAAQARDAWVLGLPVLMRQALLLALLVAIGFAVIDVFWKRLEFTRRNRMTRQEVEDEHKESEGDPHLKAARRQRAVDIALGTMLADVEKADVVIVNPTHYAVALEWKRGGGRAPVCLAKGVDDVALRIRERAREHKVPIWADPPCARALHATVKIGEEITREQFGPVAAAIRFAEQMRVKARQGWGGAAEGRATDGGRVVTRKDQLAQLARVAQLQSDIELRRFAAFRAHVVSAQAQVAGIQSELSEASAQAAPDSLDDLRALAAQIGLRTKALLRAEADVASLTPRFDAAREQAARAFGRAQALDRMADQADRQHRADRNRRC